MKYDRNTGYYCRSFRYDGPKAVQQASQWISKKTGIPEQTVASSLHSIGKFTYELDGDVVASAKMWPAYSRVQVMYDYSYDDKK